MPREVAGGDQRVVGVGRQPAVSGTQQLVDLVRGDPVVLGVVEHRQHDVELAQGVSEPKPALQDEPYVTGVAPLGELLVERQRFRPYEVPTERIEQPVHELRAAACGQHRYLDPQRAGPLRQLRAGRALARQRTAEDLAERDGEQRGGRVRAVVDVLGECGVRRSAAPLALTAPHECDGVHLQQQRRRAALGRGLGVEHVGAAVGGGERLRLPRVLVQQKAQVSCRVRGGAGGGDRQEHAPEYVLASPVGPTDFVHPGPLAGAAAAGGAPPRGRRGDDVSIMTAQRPFS